MQTSSFAITGLSIRLRDDKHTASFTLADNEWANQWPERDSMQGRHAMGCLLWIWLALMGCAGIQVPTDGVWIALPESIEVERPLFFVKLAPQKGQYPYFESFLLTITNKSDDALIVDWNKCRYLFGGRAHGVFVFEGIDPAMVKSASIPSEPVAPGAVFSREIMPMQLIAWSPIKEKTAAGRGITAGMLPAGDNGIRLALQHKTEAITIPLSIRIKQKNAP